MNLKFGLLVSSHSGRLISPALLDSTALKKSGNPSWKLRGAVNFSLSMPSNKGGSNQLRGGFPFFVSCERGGELGFSRAARGGRFNFFFDGGAMGQHSDKKKL